ncbi:hypothetical protein WME88_27455 [Sorangium sp. So ce216]
MTVSVGPVMPEQTCEITISDDSAIGEAIVALEGQWEYVGPAPAEPGGG